MEANKRITWLDAAKGYGILLVIFAHVDYSYLRNIIYTFHMPLFFFCLAMYLVRKSRLAVFCGLK